MAESSEITSYEQLLIATEAFLRLVGERGWAEWLHKDVVAWQADRDVSHHLQAYGGMGSFNDVIICRINGHTVSLEQEPWAQSLFVWLKALLLFHFCQSPFEVADKHKLMISVGRDEPSLKAFVGGERVPKSMRGFADLKVTVTGARCLTCGHAEITLRDIDWALADVFIPTLLFEACEGGTLDMVIKQVLGMHLSGLDAKRDTLRFAVAALGATFVNRDGWMRPCPKCGADDSAAYRWNFVDGNPPRCEPAANNLRLKPSIKGRRLRNALINAISNTSVISLMGRLRLLRRPR